MTEPEPFTETLTETLSRLRQRSETAMRELEALPCRLLDDESGAAKCRELATAEGCRYRQEEDHCPIKRLVAADLEFERHLLRGGVPPLERDWLIATRRDRSRLKPTLALRAVAAVVTRKPFEYHGAEGEAFVRGAESLLVLAGPTGVGKTIAACYALAKLGGKYTRGYALGAERLTRDDRQMLGAAPCVVVDQLGRTQDRDSYAAQTVEELVDLRTSERRLTIFVGNFYRHDFEQTFGEVVTSRLAGSGAWLELKGADLRRQP